MLLTDAIHLICSDLCLQVHPVASIATQSVQIVPGKISEDSVATWLVDGGQFFTLIKYSMNTLVYCHGNKTLFYAKPDFLLKSDTPDGHAFLGQMVEDDHGGQKVPRLLVMDLVSPRIESPSERGTVLRSLGAVLPPSCCLQWSGNPEALRKFLHRGLPHKVAGILALDRPLRMTKEMSLEIPTNKRAMEEIMEIVGQAGEELLAKRQRM